MRYALHSMRTLHALRNLMLFWVKKKVNPDPCHKNPQKEGREDIVRSGEHAKLQASSNVGMRPSLLHECRESDLTMSTTVPSMLSLSCTDAQQAWHSSLRDSLKREAGAIGIDTTVRLDAAL